MVNKKVVLISSLVVVLILLIIPLASAVKCYQETANVSSVCGLNTGRYQVNITSSPLNYVDGQWGTMAIFAFNDFVYINYTKPEFSSNSSLWQIEDETGRKNLSLISDCWAYSATKIELLVNQTGTSGTPKLAYHCKNTTGWLKIADSGSPAAIALEEGLWWDVNYPFIPLVINTPPEGKEFTYPAAKAFPLTTIQINYTSANAEYCNITVYNNSGAIASSKLEPCGNNVTLSLNLSRNLKGHLQINLTSFNGSYTNVTSRNIGIGIIAPNMSSGFVFKDIIKFYMNTSDFGDLGVGYCHIAHNSTFCYGEMTCPYVTASSGYLNCSIIPGTCDEPITMWMSCIQGDYTFNSSKVTGWVDSVAPYSTELRFDNAGTSFFARNITGQFNYSDWSYISRVNITIDGVSIYENNSVDALSFKYKLNRKVDTLKIGSHTLSFLIADSHTGLEIGNYQVSRPLLSTQLGYDTGANYIKITALDERVGLFNPFTTKKLPDRYTFDYKPSDEMASSYKFKVETDSDLRIVNHPDTPYKTWIISGNNWIDFYTPGSDNEVKITQIDAKTVEVEVIKSELAKDEPTKEITFNSVGDLNIVVVNYTFYTHNVSITYQSTVRETELQQIITNLTTSVPITTLPPNYAYALIYNYTAKAYTTSGNFTFISNFSSPSIAATANYPFTIYLNYSGENSSWSFNQTIALVNLTECLNASSNDKVLSLCAFDEVTNAAVVNYSLNLDISIWINDDTVTPGNLHYEFNDASCYNFCVFPNTSTYNIYSIMEYYATDYSNRKYYLFNISLNVSDPKTVNLYLLNNSLSNNINMEVDDISDGSPVSDVYIKIMRYYPGQNAYKIVEIEKTDDSGKTLAKLAAYDVFYKYILEYPIGTVVLSTDVQKVLSTDKVFVINLQGYVNENWYKVDDVNSQVCCCSALDFYDVCNDCTGSSNACQLKWDTTSGVVETGTLKVWEFNGFSKELLYEATASEATGSLVHVINASNNTRYIVEGYIGTGAEQYLAGTAEIYHEDTIFSQEAQNRIGLIIPLILLMVSIAAMLIDFGTIGVIIGSTVTLILGIVIGILPLSFSAIVTIIILAFILIFKLRS